MSEQTKIAWCDSTINFWSGCTKVSAGCANCYAEMLSKRGMCRNMPNGPTIGGWGKGAPRKLHESAFKLALRLNKKPWVCVPCFVKQFGSYSVTDNANMFDFEDDMRITGEGEGFAAGRIHWKHPKGGDDFEWPNDLRMQQFPLEATKTGTVGNPLAYLARKARENGSS